MKKIPTYLERDWDGDRSRVVDAVHPGCEWVLAGEGTATRKYDGTCVMYDGVRWWARREVKEGGNTPEGFWAIENDTETGKTVGWEPVENSPFVKFHTEALAFPPLPENRFAPGTYELIGPKVQGNPEHTPGHHLLIPHEKANTMEVPDRSYEGILAVLKEVDWEGIVFHHADGRMAKVKRRDFGLKRG